MTLTVIDHQQVKTTGIFLNRSSVYVFVLYPANRRKQLQRAAGWRAAGDRFPLLTAVCEEQRSFGVIKVCWHAATYTWDQLCFVAAAPAVHFLTLYRERQNYQFELQTDQRFKRSDSTLPGPWHIDQTNSMWVSYRSDYQPSKFEDGQYPPRSWWCLFAVGLSERGRSAYWDIHIRLAWPCLGPSAALPLIQGLVTGD